MCVVLNLPLSRPVAAAFCTCLVGSMFPTFSISPSEMSVTNNLVSLMNQLKRSSSVDRLHDPSLSAQVKDSGSTSSFSLNLLSSSSSKSDDEADTNTIGAQSSSVTSSGSSVATAVMRRSLSNEHLSSAAGGMTMSQAASTTVFGNFLKSSVSLSDFSSSSESEKINAHLKNLSFAQSTATSSSRPTTASAMKQPQPFLIPSSSSSSSKSLFRESPTKQKPTARHINFSNRCSVVLIPSRKEYVDAGIDLWISKSEQSVAQNEVVDEVRGLLDHNPALTIRMAISFLYQPRVTDDIDEETDGGPGMALNSESSSMRLSSSEPSYRSSESESGKIPSSPNTSSSSSIQYSDSKERLNILIIDSSVESFENTKYALKQILIPYQRWVISCKHCRSDVEALELLYKSTNLVNTIDVVIVDQSICEMMDDQHDSDVKTLIMDIKSASDNAVVGLTMNPLPNLNHTKSADSTSSSAKTDGETSPTTSSSSNESGDRSTTANDYLKNEEEMLLRYKQETYKEAAKKGNIDFIWRKPIQYFVPMLPMILSAAQAMKLKALNPNLSKPYESPQRSNRKSLRMSF